MDAMGASPVGWGAEDRARALAYIERLQIILSKHFAHEEEAGYVAGAAELAPRLSKVAERLLSEHDQLCTDLDEVEEIARSAQADVDVRAFRREAREWIRNMRKHEQDENRLIQRAYAEDLGGAG